MEPQNPWSLRNLRNLEKWLFLLQLLNSTTTNLKKSLVAITLINGENYKLQANKSGLMHLWSASKG